MTSGRSPVDPSLGVALRRVVVGYRIVGALWLWLLVVVVLLTETRFNLAIVVAAGVLTAVWTIATISYATRRPAVLMHPLWIASDVVVSAAVIALAAFADTQRGFYGGYPFSTVLLAAHGGGYPGGFLAAGALSLASIAFLNNAGEVISSSLVYLAGAGVTVWGFDVIRRNDAQRRALEQRLAAEEAERARSQERADTAAALHDSVLQTLALIQRRSDDPAAVATLARRQERDLRDWLAGRGRLGGATETTFAAALADAAADVERDYPLTVEVVAVGDHALEEAGMALVAASREAMVNAAKHAGVESVAVYAEVSGDSTSVFVRDRGAGFDLESIPDDRHGISDSIVGRMSRYGGSATVRSSPGAGTEVELTLPR